ncbi:MAG: HEAT repeat domain-containing protein [Armatimonadota bacterium]|nr:HEAT repeat domain-containing protein [Armatimonadota bacterium]MDR7451951.1 HEAT repeat domain-containing protein [Armatimonadota bacterium]MDR7466633.1 HEAT repeat domain-containing protein [Armatimonadota bacterium]MDR7492893.1 HEAT repeat domain-containing protein [Armatimonadota bacterium]MDR7498669.1 HEAT repeat domain-containing protein [Armatimonadota bacterium]
MPAELDADIEAVLQAPWPRPDDLARLRAAADEAVAALVRRLAHEPGALRRRRICDALVDAAADDPGRLRPYLDHPSWYVARNLAYVLGETRHPQAVAPLAVLARHPEYRVRREVLDALRKIPGGRSREMLRRFATDPDARLRRHLIDGLGSTYDPEIASWLLAVVRSRDYTREGISLKEAAIAALTRMGAAEARPVLEQVARRRWAFGPARKLQEAARGALAQTDPSAAVYASSR